MKCTLQFKVYVSVLKIELCKQASLEVVDYLRTVFTQYFKNPKHRPLLKRLEMERLKHLLLIHPQTRFAYAEVVRQIVADICLNQRDEANASPLMLIEDIRKSKAAENALNRQYSANMVTFILAKRNTFCP